MQYNGTLNVIPCVLQSTIVLHLKVNTYIMNNRWPLQFIAKRYLMVLSCDRNKTLRKFLIYVQDEGTHFIQKQPNKRQNIILCPSLSLMLFMYCLSFFAVQSCVQKPKTRAGSVLFIAASQNLWLAIRTLNKVNNAISYFCLFHGTYIRWWLKTFCARIF